jgi:hypothetical protein
MDNMIYHIPDWANISTVSNPTASSSKIYPKSDGWYVMDDTGTEKNIVVGTGTLNYLPKFASGGLSDSVISDDGTNVNISILSGTGDRMVESDSSGTITASRSVINTFGIPNTEKLKLENPSNWDVNGEYIGTAITGTYQGQKHYDDNYLYEAVANDFFIRLIRG